jgi:hypothetical protein
LKTEGRPEIQMTVSPAGTTETTMLPCSCPTEETTYTADTTKPTEEITHCPEVTNPTEVTCAPETTILSCTYPPTTYCPTEEHTTTSLSTLGILQVIMRILLY